MIIKRAQLNKDELQAIDALAKENLEKKGYCNKIYWNIITARNTDSANDYLYYDNDQLIAYLAVYEFTHQSKEISLILHHQYEKKEIITEMLQAFLENENPESAYYYDFILARADNILTDMVLAQNPEKISSHVEMKLVQMPSLSKLPSVRVIRANSQDLLMLAKIGSESFNSNFVSNLARFSENLKEENRRIWLVYHQGKIVGKIHVRFDLKYKAFIHDLGILKEFRGKKLATSMILKTIESLQKEGFDYFYLDVDYLNEHALKLYRNCGFENVVIYDAWRLTPKKLTEVLSEN